MDQSQGDTARASRLLRLRRLAFLGQVEMASLLGVSSGHYSKLERGHNPLTPKVLGAIARAFNDTVAAWVEKGGPEPIAPTPRPPQPAPPPPTPGGPGLLAEPSELYGVPVSELPTARIEELILITRATINDPAAAALVKHMVEVMHISEDAAWIMVVWARIRKSHPKAST